MSGPNTMRMCGICRTVHREADPCPPPSLSTLKANAEKALESLSGRAVDVGDYPFKLEQTIRAYLDALERENEQWKKEIIYCLEHDPVMRAKAKSRIAELERGCQEPDYTPILKLLGFYGNGDRTLHDILLEIQTLQTDSARMAWLADNIHSEMSFDTREANEVRILFDDNRPDVEGPSLRECVDQAIQNTKEDKKR